MLSTRGPGHRVCGRRCSAEGSGHSKLRARQSNEHLPSMTTPPLVLDGLWHCLCPTFRHVPSETRRALLRASARRPTVPRPNLPASTRRQPTRLSSTHVPLTYVKFKAQAWRESGTRLGEQQRAASALDALDQLDTHTIYNLLRLRASEGDVDQVNQLVSYLLVKRREKPNTSLYSAKILANVSPEHGSAAAAASLLKEMGQTGTEPTAEICHDVIKVVAVHPDYLLRAAILEYMRQRWFNLTAEGHHDLVVGLLRERQFEMALSHLDSMPAEGVPVGSWLYDMALYMLCDAGEIDEALRIIRQRADAGDLDISKAVWYTLLDAASHAFHVEATDYIWKRHVAPGHITPSSGTCFNILVTAARYGDTELATDVFRLLSERKEIFTQQHYEMLVDTYIHAGDIKTALSVVCIMQESGTPPDEYSTRKLFTWARSHPERAQEAYGHLQSLREEGYSVPVAAINTIIEASIYCGNIDQAIDQYKALHNLCESGPTTTTFNVLFRGCVKRKDLAMFLAAEMVELKVEPDSLTYDRLLLICLNEPENYEDAFRYYEEMRGRGWVPRVGTFIAMVKRCARAEDRRAWEIVDVMRECRADADSVRFVREWLDVNWGKVSEADAELTR